MEKEKEHIQQSTKKYAHENKEEILKKVENIVRKKGISRKELRPLIKAIVAAGAMGLTLSLTGCRQSSIEFNEDGTTIAKKGTILKVKVSSEENDLPEGYYNVIGEHALSCGPQKFIFNQSEDSNEENVPLNKASDSYMPLDEQTLYIPQDNLEVYMPYTVIAASFVNFRLSPLTGEMANILTRAEKGKTIYILEDDTPLNPNDYNIWRKGIYPTPIDPLYDDINDFEQYLDLYRRICSIR